MDEYRLFGGFISVVERSRGEAVEEPVSMSVEEPVATSVG